MYVRISNFTLGPGTRNAAESLADEVNRAYRALPGFRSVQFYADFDKGEYGGLSVWQTRTDADNAGQALKPIMEQKAGALLKGTPSVQTFELYEPKT